jgi:hypothetical protein
MYRTLLSVMILFGSFSTAYAIGSATQTYCAYDYLRHCSAYSLSSPNLPKCMANVGINLSRKCIQALVDDGLVTKEEVIARAAKQGVVVRDGDKGLYVDNNAKVGEEIATVEMPKEEIKTVEVGTEAKNAVIATENVAKRVYTKAKKTVQKAATAVKTKYKKITKNNKEYAKRPNIVEQNRLRSENNGISSEGINADFGRYEARRPGFTPPKTYNWKQRQESKEIYSSGVNGY